MVLRRTAVVPSSLMQGDVVVSRWDLVEGIWRRATRPMLGVRYVAWVGVPVLLVVATSGLRVFADGNRARENLGALVTALVAIGAGWLSIVHSARARALAAADRLCTMFAALSSEVAVVRPAESDAEQPWRAPPENQALLDRYSALWSQLLVARLVPDTRGSDVADTLLSLVNAGPGREWSELRDHARRDLLRLSERIAERWLL